VPWWVSILPEVVRGIESCGFTDPPPDKILEAVEQSIALNGEAYATDRWDQCPDDFFVYTHIFIEGGRYHTLEFVVEDTSAEAGVLKVAWVEHHPGGLV
jgi:hypothetical protein